MFLPNTVVCFLEVLVDDRQAVSSIDVIVSKTVKLNSLITLIQIFTKMFPLPPSPLLLCNILLYSTIKCFTSLTKLDDGSTRGTHSYQRHKHSGSIELSWGWQIKTNIKLLFSNLEMQFCRSDGTGWARVCQILSATIRQRKSCTFVCPAHLMADNGSPFM